MIQDDNDFAAFFLPFMLVQESEEGTTFSEGHLPIYARCQEDADVVASLLIRGAQARARERRD